MKIENFDLFNFSKDLFEDCSIRCHCCREYINHNLWLESSVGCDDCGEHFAIKCPECGFRIDHIHSPLLDVK